MSTMIEGIVLKKVDYREHDAMLTVLSKEGKISILARGIQKLNSKNAPACQPFAFSSFELLDKGHGLKKAELIENYRKIREDLLKQSIASIMIEVMDRLEEEMADFKKLKTCLDLLADAKQPYCVLALFLSVCCAELGISAFVDGCIRCGNQQEIAGFSVVDGGFVCAHCLKISDVRLDVEKLRLLRMVCKAELKHYEVLAAYSGWDYQIVELLLGIFVNYSGVSLKSGEFLAFVEGLN